MVASAKRQLALSSLRPVSGLRQLVSERLTSLSDTGKLESPLRRDWLLSTVHDIEEDGNGNMREMCESLKQVAYMSGEIDHMELLLTPLREYVRRWAAIIRDTH